MIRIATVTLTLLASAGLSAEARAVAGQEDETLEWLDDYDEAIALAKQTGRPLFLEFRCAP